MLCAVKVTNSHSRKKSCDNGFGATEVSQASLVFNHVIRCRRRKKLVHKIGTILAPVFLPDSTCAVQNENSMPRRRLIAPSILIHQQIIICKVSFPIRTTILQPECNWYTTVLHCLQDLVQYIYHVFNIYIISRFQYFVILIRMQ